jgi:signal transduction histidine kinase
VKSNDTPIKQKLISIILLTCCVVLVMTCGGFLTYELLTFRQTMLEHLSTMGRVIANNSNAALTYLNQKDATEVLSALKEEPRIVAAGLYDRNGKLFATYPANPSGENVFPTLPSPDGVYYERSHMLIFVPVIQSGFRVGTLYLNSDTGDVYERFRPYSGIAVAVMLSSLAMAYVLSSFLQRQISRPVLALAETAKAISERRDYSVRAPDQGKDEFGLMTDAFNNMLEQIHIRDNALRDAQEKLKEHAEQLELRVVERTARLSETIAELEAFSYSISHDMRAPLRAMRGYSDYMIGNYGSQLGEEGRAYLERISRAGRRLDNLIQDILTYSHISRAQLDLHPVDLDKLVDDILQQYPGLQEPKASITIAKPLHPVVGHDASLTQVISNLLGNAVKFMPPGKKPVVKLWTEERGDEVRLWVEDNGIGIAAKDLDRIFGIFERVYPEKTYEGTGIGLSIVRKGTERMGGTSGVESEPDRGSRFWVQLRKAVNTESETGIKAPAMAAA